MATVRDVQQRLISLGFPLPRFGADGDAGGETLTAINGALDELVTLRGGSKPTPAPPRASTHKLSHQIRVATSLTAAR